jgi:hypothetical protein
MNQKNLFKKISKDPRLESTAFLSPFWWSYNDRYFLGMIFGGFILFIPFFALATFFFLLTQIGEVGFSLIRPFILSETLWPIVIIVVSFYYRNFIFKKAQGSRGDKKPSSIKLKLLRFSLFSRLFLLLAAIPLVMSFLVGLDSDFRWIEKYLDLGWWDFFLGYFK